MSGEWLRLIRLVFTPTGSSNLSALEYAMAIGNDQTYLCDRGLWRPPPTNEFIGEGSTRPPATLHGRSPRPSASSCVALCSCPRSLSQVLSYLQQRLLRLLCQSACFMTAV